MQTRPAMAVFETESVAAARRYMSEVFRSHDLSMRARARPRSTCGTRRCGPAASRCIG